MNMRVIARTRTAIFLRLPLEMQLDCGGCDCAHCKRNPALAKWDTLCVPLQNRERHHDYAHTVHMPDPSVQEFIDINRRLETREAPLRKWHRVKPEDSKRIPCSDCGNPAYACEHVENPVSIAFWYYCHSCATKRSGKGLLADCMEVV